MAEDGQHIKGADRNTENVEQASVMRGLVTDAAIVAAPVVGAWAQAHFGKCDEPTQAPPPPSPPQKPPKKD